MGFPKLGVLFWGPYKKDYMVLLDLRWGPLFRQTNSAAIPDEAGRQHRYIRFRVCQYYSGLPRDHSGWTCVRFGSLV